MPATLGRPGVFRTRQVLLHDGWDEGVAPMLDEIADGVWVRRSNWVWSNSIVARVEGGALLVDPGISGDELAALADDVAALGLPVVAGFATHLHWDHLLWHPRLGDVPRYATGRTAAAAPAVLERGRQMAAESADGIPLELLGLVEALPEDGGPLPGRLIEHEAHAVGHAAVLLADRRVLLAGDMLSDVLVPILDPRREGQEVAYDDALDLLERAAAQVDVVVPGHGSPARGEEIARRFAADRAFLAARRRGEQPQDERFGPR